MYYRVHLFQLLDLEDQVEDANDKLAKAQKMNSLLSEDIHELKEEIEEEKSESNRLNAWKTKLEKELADAKDIMKEGIQKR